VWTKSSPQNFRVVKTSAAPILAFTAVTPTEVQLIVSLATILSSGVLSAIVTHKLSTGRAEREFRRKKLEELFIAVHTYCNKLFSVNIVWPRVMKGEIDYNQGLELVIKNQGEKEDSGFDAATMLVNIYFPELRPRLQAILQRRDQINQIHSEFKQSYQQGRPCGSFLKPFLAELSAIDADEKALTDDLFRISEKYR
jgi:hypothetical protein